MSITGVSAITHQITPQQVSASALKAAQGDGDGRRGAAALNDGDAAAQRAAVTANRSTRSVDVKA